MVAILEVMAEQQNNSPRDTRHAGIRPAVFIAVIGLVLLVLLATVFLSRPDATKVPKESAPATGATPERESTGAGPRDSRRTDARSLIATTEPMYRGKALSEWISDLESTDADAVKAARLALKELGPLAAPAIPQLAQMLYSDRTANRAAFALVDIGTNSLPFLIEALQNGNRSARLEAALAVGEFRGAGEAAVPALVACMKYDDDSVRVNAIGALQSIPKRPDIAVPALIECLADQDASGRATAATVLLKYGASAEPAVPALLRAAREDSDPHVRERAAMALRAIAPQRAEAEGL